jgi:hypothetical protein
MHTSSAAFRGGVDSTHWARERLDSWKEVASFFRREVRTVQLWEKSEGFPVRRQQHKKLGSVPKFQVSSFAPFNVAAGSEGRGDGDVVAPLSLRSAQSRM